MIKQDDLHVYHPQAAGLDVHKMQVTATVRRPRADGQGFECETREFSALPSGLLQLVMWLVYCKVSGVAMEATGIFWEQVYDRVRAAGLQVLVPHAQHVKQLQGRKTDRSDSEWLARVSQFQLALSSLVLSKPFRDWRQLSRYRRAWVRSRAQAKTRVQKILDRNGVRIGGILTYIFGVNGRVLLEGLIAGTPREELLKKMTPHVRRKLEALGDALQAELDAHSQWMLEDLVHRQYDSTNEQILAVDRRLEAALREYRPQLQWLQTIPGVEEVSARAILIELGGEVRSFPSARHLAAWAGLGPGNNESAGKRRSGKVRQGNAGLRATLIECAHGAVRTRDSQFYRDFQKLKVRRGYKRAIVAVAHKMLRIIYAMLRDQQPYRDPQFSVLELGNRPQPPRWFRQLIEFGFVEKTYVFKDGTRLYAYHSKLGWP